PETTAASRKVAACEKNRCCRLLSQRLLRIVRSGRVRGSDPRTCPEGTPARGAGLGPRPDRGAVQPRPRLAEDVAEDAGHLVELGLAGDERRRDLDHRVAA